MSKKSSKFDYPHPLIKNLHSKKVYTPQNLHEMFKQKPKFYDNNYLFSLSIKDAISPKLVRLSNSKSIPEQKFGLLMQPFHSKQQVQRIQKNLMEQQHFKCQNCKAFLSSQSQSVSLYQIRCRICNRVQSISPQLKNQLQSIPRYYDLCEREINNSPISTEKNICFVIQASEFNYNYRIHEVIRSCLESLKSTLESFQIRRKYSQVQTQDEDVSTKSNPTLQDYGDSQNVNYNVSFILFNNKNIFLINQSTSDVMVFNELFLSGQQVIDSHYLINFNDFFRPIFQISEETFSLIQDILYDSYLKYSSCLDTTTEFIHKYIDRFMLNDHQKYLNQNLSYGQKIKNRKVEYKFFINSLKFTKRTYLRDQKQKNVMSTIENISDNISGSPLFSKKKKSNLEQNESQISQVTLSSNFEFFYLPQSQANSVYVSQKEVIIKLNNNLYKMYPSVDRQTKNNDRELFNQLYYDLFQNLTTDKYFDIKVDIITSKYLQVLAVGNQALGYNDYVTEFKEVQSSSSRNQKYNHYEIVLKSLQPNNILPFDLKIAKTLNSKNNNHSISETMHFMQISFKYSKSFLSSEDQPFLKNFKRVFQVQMASLERAINIRERIYSSLSTYVDDQTLFYFYLRWIMIECHKTKTNHTILNKLIQQIEQISDQFKDIYGHIDFHKEYVRIFLYSFMITNKALANAINQNFYFERHLFIKNSMQCFSKSLYPRTYSIQKSKDSNKVGIKNVKSTPKNFRSDSIVLLDNSKNLYIIIGQDTTVQELKEIFGTCFINEIQQIIELPQLQSNILYRELIDLIRAQHESNYLPLKIFQLFSTKFDSELSHLLYRKDDHEKFMRKLWDMESSYHKTK